MHEPTWDRTLSVTVVLLLLSLLGLTGCGDWVPPPIAPKYAALLPASVTGERLLVVFTYGFGCSATSRGNGLRDAAEAVHSQYPSAQVITRAWNEDDGIISTIESHRGPVILIGHSFGGCRTFEIAAALRRPVDALIALDPVPVDGGLIRHDELYFEVSANVRSAVCFYRPRGFFPISYRILHPPSGDVNRLRDLGHSEFCENAEVRQSILGICAREQSKLEQFTAAHPLLGVVQASR
jgi:pimeloyl-ACP methyl ester carboxylesterase